MKSHKEFMELAINEAQKSGNDIPVGAIIVENNRVIAKFHNQKEELNDISAHAEILAIKHAETEKRNWRLDNCIMYVTLEPCPMCATAIVNARIKEVYFGAYDLLYGALGSKLNIPSIFNSKIKVTGGINEEECSNLLKNFWRNNG